MESGRRSVALEDDEQNVRYSQLGNGNEKTWAQQRSLQKYAQLKKNPPVVLDNVQKDKTAKKKSWAPLKSKISHSVKVAARWTDQDTKILVNMRDTGKGWKEIGKYLGKSANSCRKRYERVNK